MIVTAMKLKKDGTIHTEVYEDIDQITEKGAGIMFVLKSNETHVLSPDMKIVSIYNDHGGIQK